MRWITKRFYSPYVPWRLLGLLLLIGLAINIYYLARSVALVGAVHPDRLAYTIGAVDILYAFALGGLCLKGLRQRPRNLLTSKRWTRQYLSPILIGVGIWCFSLSKVAWITMIFITQRFPAYPSPEHFTQFATYPFFIGAILLLPAQNISWRARLRVLLDSLMIIVAIATLCYYFLLAPLLVNGTGILLEKATGGVFLVADLILLFSLLLVALQYGEPILQPALVLFFLAILIFFIVHIIHAYELIYHRSYNEFSSADAGLTLAGILLVGAAQTVTNILNQRAATEGPMPEQATQMGITGTPRTLWRGKAVLPSILVLIFGLFILNIWLSNGQKAPPGRMLIVYAGGFVVLILMLLRQFLTLRQIDRLRNQLQRKNRALSLLNYQLGQLATTDPLTGLPNHRRLVEQLDEAMAHAQATHSSCALIFIDIDHFKAINDRYGHSVGDVILRQFSETARSCLPSRASIGRWGGEEFVAILPQCDLPEALDMAENIRSCADREVRAGDKYLHMTCSLGVATYPQDASTRDYLIMQADRAMYAAKSLGRNQVRSAHEPLALALERSEKEVATSEREEMLETVDVLFSLLEARDYLICQHSKRVAALSLKLAHMLGLGENEAQMISLGGLLHELGKVAVSDAALHMHDQPDSEERAHMLQEILIGAEILAPVPSLQAVAEIVRARHEHMDGSGYPDGLRGEEIPPGARIVAIADAYDSITSRCAGCPARSSAEALRELQACSGSQFDPRVVEALARLLVTAPHRSTSDVA